jgi:hypothetical protein
LNLSLDGKSLASLSFTGTQDDWNAYEEATGKATLTKGEHVLRITIANANTNVDYVKFSLVGGDNPPQAIAKMLVASASATYSVFDFKGQFIGKVEVASGSSIAQAIKASFHKAGVYMVKNGNVARRIAVK